MSALPLVVWVFQSDHQSRKRRVTNRSARLDKFSWGEEVREPDAAQHLGPDAIGDHVDDLGSVLRGVDVNAEWAFAEWGVDDLDDGFGDFVDVGVGGHDSGEALHDL